MTSLVQIDNHAAAVTGDEQPLGVVIESQFVNAIRKCGNFIRDFHTFEVNESEVPVVASNKQLSAIA